MKSRLLLNLLLLTLVTGLTWLAIHEPGREQPPPPLALTTLTPGCKSASRRSSSATQPSSSDMP